ncbi:MAG TPA: DUF4189 domain-containing protein, partial [Xanthobacteraceae bacterium]
MVGAILLAAVQGMTPVARAEGALAVGASGNFAKDGFAVGGAIDKATKQDAIDQALAPCRKYEGAPKMAAICRIVATFRRECFAINFDPKPGTPGVGWAVGPTKAAAEERALAACQTTAGAARRKFCKLEQSFC